MVSTIASLVILIAFRKLRDEQKLAQVSLALIFSGAVGNLIDRIRLGEVIDFSGCILENLPLAGV